MLPILNSYSILYTVFTWFLGMCYGFVLLSSAAGQTGDLKLFETGESLTYRLHSTVLLNEKDSGSKNVGFSVTGDVVVKTVWENSLEKLLKIELNSLQLHIKSRKAPSPDGFVPHSSKLDGFQKKPFLVVWNKGRIDRILIPKGDPLSLVNLKKGVASLLQFQILDGQSSETDASGQCSITYTSQSPTNILKTKTDCVPLDFYYISNPDEILGTKVQSSRQTEYQFDASSHIKSVKSKETHEVYITSREEIGNRVEATQVLDFVKSESTSTVVGDDIGNVIEKIGASDGVTYTQETLLTDLESIGPEEDVTFSKEVDNLRDSLKSEYLGTLKPTKAFILLVNNGRRATKQDLVKALESKKNKKILSQLYDIMGYVQTEESHEAVMKQLHFDDDSQIDLSERYLWALSFSSQPNLDIIKDLIHKYTRLDNSLPDKVKETLILTIASMAHKLTKLHKNVQLILVQEVEELILNNLEHASDSAQFVFFRALKNLQSESSIPFLLEFVRNGTRKEGVLSFKALKSFNPKLWSEEVLKVAEKSFFQIDRRYDSSSRTLAADILVESNPSNELLEHMLNFLLSNDRAFEVKQYAFQRIRMKADEDPEFKKRVDSIIKKNHKINNYSGLSPKGLSTALRRSFLKSPSSNGSLVSVQEIKDGIAKRGIVNVVLDKDSVFKELFSLGIFCSGLNNFIASSSDSEEEEVEDEDIEFTSAGMELSVLGTQIRPFVFFNGQTELMGHVWSGTGSEKTTAFQALALLQDHHEYLRLGSGFVAELDVKGATSFDLSGKIEISIWNRNAQSLVEKSAGVVVISSTKIDTSFVKSQIEFNASVEPKLNLETDIDFSSDVQLCMRLTQPESLFKHNVFKIERIPGSKHKIRISKYKKYTVPGTTYFINKKNNDMCNAIFS